MHYKAQVLNNQLAIMKALKLSADYEILHGDQPVDESLVKVANLLATEIGETEELLSDGISQ